MRKIFALAVILMSGMFAFVQANAVSPDSSDAVTMESYEQTYMDRKGTIALKNNTSETIHNVRFVLEYLDKSGKQLDYQEYSYDIEIAPGKTRKLDLPAYEPDRHYHYYKTRDMVADMYPAFKLRYELKGYNSNGVIASGSGEAGIAAESGGSDFSDGSDMTEIESSLEKVTKRQYVILGVLLLVLGIYVGMYVLVAVMAKQRNRNPAVWLLLSFIATPLLICLILLVIGKSYRDEYYQ